MLRSLVLSLGLTLILELSVAWLLRLREKRDLLLIALVNVFTNPLVVLTLNLYVRFSGFPPPWILVLPLEMFAVTAEWLIYRRGLSHRPVSPLILSLILNGISYLGGLLLS